jgi:DNA repair protein RadC
MRYQSVEQLDTRDLFGLALREQASSALDNLIKTKPSLHDLSMLTTEDIQMVTGLDADRSMQVKAIIELARRYAMCRPTKPASIRGATDVVELLKDMLFLDREVFKVLLLNTKHHVIHIDTVAIGDLNSCSIHPREVFKSAIRFSAAAVILAHNHPSGDPEPSQDDILITARLVDVGKIVGISVLDHVILGQYGYVSLRDRGVAFK